MGGEAPKGTPEYHVCASMCRRHPRLAALRPREECGSLHGTIASRGEMATTSKPYDKVLPFTRINSPSENLLPTRLSGDGHTRGTRREGDFYEQALIDKVVRKLILLTPSWTTTRGTTERDVEQEIQGKMARSFQTWTDAPPFQWHRWYDWHFHLEPDAGYDWLRGMANHATPSGERPKIVNHNPFS